MNVSKEIYKEAIKMKIKYIVSILTLIVLCVGMIGCTPKKATEKINLPDNNPINQVNPPNNENPPINPPTGNGNPVPVESLTGVLKNKFTMAAVTDGFYRFYAPGADVSDPYVKSLDSIDVSVGASSNLVIQTDTNYDVYYESDGATYYDEKIDNWQINYNPETGKGYLMSGDESYLAVNPVGAFEAVDTLPEVETGMDQTGQDNDKNNITAINGTAVLFGDTDATTCSVFNVYNSTAVLSAGNYSISGCYFTLTNVSAGDGHIWNNTLVTVNYTKTRANLLRYNESLLAGSGWFKMDIGNSNANSVLEDVVMCFRDNDGDMEGNEITAFTASYVSGSTAIQIPGSLQQYWEDAMGGSGAQCFKIASELGSSQKARWQFTMTVDEAEWDAGEEFEMTFDDLGGYLAKQYPSRSVKATAVSLTIGNNA
jgi:hypothetical protein